MDGLIVGLLARIASTQNRLDPCHQFTRIEGFGEVIVCAELKAENFVDIFIPRREHDDGSLIAVRTQSAADIEVKGRVGVGEIELTENEWARACILRERYWLYAVFDCGGVQPRLLRVQDPFAKLIAKARGSVVIAYRDIANAAEAVE